jgi:quinol monooxygenase YgiN
MNMKKVSFKQRSNHLQKVLLKKFLIKRKQYMKNLVIVSFPAKAETLDQVKELLTAALPDTRSFAGCISVSTYIEESSNTVHLIEDWETLDHQTEYLTWRVETGLLELLEPLLEGGAASLKATICGPEHTDI